MRGPARYPFQRDARTWFETPRALCMQAHRTRGPAIEWDDGGKLWFIHGKYVYGEHPGTSEPRKFDDPMCARVEYAELH